MKRMLMSLALLVMATPAWADVTRGGDKPQPDSQGLPCGQAAQ